MSPLLVGLRYIYRGETLLTYIKLNNVERVFPHIKYIVGLNRHITILAP